ncbi:MAG: HlyD family efflux transporter periplasmic adaptor subunit [Bacteroidetes bacterium]|nr:MAG: HlyD family efflux transporter periplasmic adaptor subunit [Bacteroidota bacterium]
MPELHRDRSNETQQFLSQKPPFGVRWGIMIFFVVLLLTTVACWFVQYPDLVMAKARLTGMNTPKEVTARSEGRILQLPVKNNESVKKGQLLAVLESRGQLAAIGMVQTTLDSIESCLQQNHTEAVAAYFDRLNGVTSADLGELQPPYQNFMQAFITILAYVNNGFFLQKKSMLYKDMNQLKTSYAILTKQQVLLAEDVALSEETFLANEKLAQQQVLSPMEYRGEKGKLIGKKLSLPQIEASLANNMAQQLEKQKELAALEHEIGTQKQVFANAVKAFYGEILAWRYKYLMEAPEDGTLQYAAFFQENQQVKTGQTLFFVEPHNAAYFAEMLVPQYNFGKVEVGQQVLLKLAAYPPQQFGTLLGTISEINNAPTDSGFLAKVALPYGLQTNYRKQVFYRNGLMAQADIITQNMNLLERFYFNIKKSIQR